MAAAAVAAESDHESLPLAASAAIACKPAQPACLPATPVWALQERLWKQTAALAVAYEVAKLKGRFGLRPPPEGQRAYHDEIVGLRTAVAKEAGERTGGRRSGAACVACCGSLSCLLFAAAA
jgi:hypothetical protein